MMKCKAKDIGRILMGIVFVVFGLLKISGFAGTVAYIKSVGIPLPEVMAVLSIVIEVGGGLTLILNRFREYGVYILSGYLVIITLIFHRDLGNQAQLGMFLKNLGILAGLLMFCGCRSCQGGCCENGNQVAGEKSGCCGGNCH